MKMPSVDDRGIIAASSVYDKHEMWETSLGFELKCRCPELHFVHPGFVPDVPGLMKEAVEAYEKDIFLKMLSLLIALNQRKWIRLTS